MSIRTKLMRVEMLLRHVLYVSYLVPASRLRPIVPDMLPLAVVEGNSGFVSVVVLRSTRVGLSSLPFPRFDYSQINVRTYVTDPHSGNQAVHFLKSGVTSTVISLLTRTIGVPWEHMECAVNVRVDEQLHYDAYEAFGQWGGDFFIKAEEAMMPPTSMLPFKDTESAIDYLVRPLTGFFAHKGRVGRFRIWHPDVKPRAGIIKDFHFPLLNSMNVIDQTVTHGPDSVLLVPEARFHIYMPPSLVKSK
jgi:hypothetical protein